MTKNQMTGDARIQHREAIVLRDALRPLCLALIPSLVLCHPSSASDWPRFRGPGGTCLSDDKDIPVQWSARKNLQWRLALPGRGASSPITWRDRVFVTCYSGYGVDGDRPGDRADLERHLLCVRRTDGKVLWKATMPSKAPVQAYEGSVLNHGYATHTPTVDKNGVYVFYGSSGAASYTHAGELRWHRSCGTKTHGYGSAASPILSGNVLIVSAHVESGAIIGLATRSGRELWRVKASRQIWCTPIIVRRGNAAALVCFKQNDLVAGLNPTSGEQLWEYQTTINDVQRVENSPLQFNNTIITAQGGYGANAFRFGGRGNVTQTHQKWKHRGIYGVPLVFNDSLITPFRGVIGIRDANTGRDVSQLRLRPSKDGFASAVIANDKLYWVFREGGVCVVQMGPQPKQLAYNVIQGDGGLFNATPAISNGQLFLRSDNYLYCIAKGRRQKSQP